MTAWRDGHSAALLGSRIVGVNFHAIAAENRAEVTRRLRLASRLGESVDLDRVQQPDQPPRVFVAFYDGYRETGMFGAELCSSLGIRACFFPIFASADPARAQLTDDDLADIATAHELGFHTRSHQTAEQITPDNLEVEVLGPMRRLEGITGRRPRIAAWRGGTRFDAGMLGDRTLQSLGVQHLVSNWSIEALPSSST